MPCPKVPMRENSWVAGDVQWWPGTRERDCGRVAVVTVSYNTRELTAFLLWSLRRIVNWPDLEILVVDNGSGDGSSELLAEAAQGGVCDLLTNRVNRHHGPGLNQGISWLASRPGPLPAWIWILDSDVVVARPDALSAALAVARGPLSGPGRRAAVGPVAPGRALRSVLAAHGPGPGLATADRAVHRRGRSVLRSAQLGRTTRYGHGCVPVHRSGSRHSPGAGQPCLGLHRPRSRSPPIRVGRRSP
jgi:glycosyltransferase involved in cell wall biosynthesis